MNMHFYNYKFRSSAFIKTGHSRNLKAQRVPTLAIFLVHFFQDGTFLAF